MDSEMPAVWVKAINLKISDMPASVGFYGEGIGLPLVASPEAGGNAVFDAGNILVVLDADEDGRSPGGTVIHFHVPDLDAFHAKLVEGGRTPDSEPSEQPWGGREFIIHDPDGHLVTICQARSDAEPS